MSNKYDNHEISKVDFIRNHISTISMKHSWYDIDESQISTDREYAGGTLCSLIGLTVEKCIEFLSSKGYSVTLTKK